MKGPNTHLLEEELLFLEALSLILSFFTGLRPLVAGVVFVLSSLPLLRRTGDFERLRRPLENIKIINN